MLIPGIHYKPLMKIEDFHLSDEQKLKQFMSLYVSTVSPQGKYINYFKRFGHGETFAAVRQLYRKFVLENKSLTSTEFTEVLAMIYDKGTMGVNIVTFELMLEEYRRAKGVTSK